MDNQEMECGNGVCVMATDDETRENLETFYTPVEMPGGFTFNHAETIKKIDLYTNDRFESGQFDSQGNKKYFYNIVRPAVAVAQKFTDLDTKDFILYSEVPGYDEEMLVMRRDFKGWLKEKKIDQLLNRSGEERPKYGHIVWRKNFDNQWELVPIQNIRLDPSSKDMECSPFVYEVMDMTRREIMDTKGWDEDAKKQLLERSDNSRFIIYDCFDQMDEGKKWHRCVKADLLRTTGNSTSAPAVMNQSAQNEYMPSVVLFCEDLDELPFRECAWEKVPGRWLGRGFVEELFENQIHRNEVANMESRALYYSSLKVFQTGEETVQRNVITDVENGDILHVKQPITVLDMSERNLAAYNSTKADWDANSDRRTFSFDISRGENLPSGTTLGVAKMSAGMVESYFQLKREDFAIFLRHVVIEDVLPNFRRVNRKKHLVRFGGNNEEMKKLSRAVSKAKTNRVVLDYIFSTGRVPDPEEIQAIHDEHEAATKGKDLMIELPDGFYDDIKVIADVLITGEQMDTSAVTQSLMTALQIIGSNPNVVVDPKLRHIFFKMLELAGVSADELGIMDDEAEAKAQQMPTTQEQMMQMMAGGGAPQPAAPTAPTQPMMPANAGGMAA